MTIAAAALAGLPPLSVFFSKELILEGLAGLNNPVWLAAGLLGVFLTAYYAFRLIFIIFFPRVSADDGVKEHMASTLGHDGGRHQYRVMVWPLIILATITLLLGFCQDLLELFLKGPAGGMEVLVKHHQSWLMYAALCLAGGGIILAWAEFGRSGAAQVGFVERIPPLKALFSERWYLDRFYRWMLARVIYGGISNLCTKNDNQVIDGGIHAVSKGIVRSGRILSELHMGMIQYKLLVMFVVILLLTLYFFF